MIILDTNVVSELMRPEPAPQVASWVRGRDRRELRTTAITIAEVRYGIARLPDGRRKQVLLAAAADVIAAFEGQVLPVDTAAADIMRLSPAAENEPGRRSPASTRWSWPSAAVRALRWRRAMCPTSTAPESRS